jgi:hypothetical protein
VRSELDLSGSWQFQKVGRLSFPPSNNWQTITVPGYLSGWQYEHAWYRKVFTLPASMTAPEFKLRFGGVKFNAEIWLNGMFLGNYLNGYEPFELDTGSAVLPGQTNELVVGVTDWTAMFSGPVDFSNLAPYEDPRDHAKNSILAPIGGRYDLYGLWQPVKIVNLPSVSIADVFVMPSVRAQQLTLRLTLRNDTSAVQAVSVTNTVVDGTNVVFSFPVEQMQVPASTNVQVDLVAPWTNAHYWTHLDPHLYSLETTISGSSGIDHLGTRFGFREFWAQNGAFFLNGIPINLHATATWPPSGPIDTNQIERVLLDVKNGNNVAMRLHTQPWDESWYDMADQVGLLIVEEAAVWCDPFSYRLGDTNFWNNYSDHLIAAVKRDHNHPSIVLWSLENEILHCGGERAYSATDQQLAAMGRLVKSIDPTRPITYEADLDPGGEATALGLHYPHEFPDFHVWPNDAYWMGQSIARDWVPGGQWLWDHTKPLYIGEFLWVPSTSAADFTILFGDDAYAAPNSYRNQAKALTWRMQIEAYRSYGVNGMAPWTLFEDPSVDAGQFDLHANSNFLYQAQKAAYEPNAVVVQEYNPRFFAGDTVQRTVHVYNDRLSVGNFTLRWSTDGVTWQNRSFDLAPAGQWSGAISFQAPAAAGGFGLHFELSNTGTVVFTNTLSYLAMPRPSLSLPPEVRIGLYDPVGSAATLLGRFGIPFTTLSNLQTAAYNQLDLLVVGSDAFTNEVLAEVGPATLNAKWQDFALHGGWVLLLEQTNFPAWLPGGLQLQPFDASFAFPNPDHPVTSGLSSEDLRWWADDHRLVIHSLAMPARGNFRAIASVGSRAGIEYAAAVEVPIGTGGLLSAQWLVSRRFDLEPLAGALFQRCLDYCASGAHLAARPAAILTETNSPALARLSGLGLQAENFSGRLASCDPVLYPVLIIAGGAAAWQEASAQASYLSNFVQLGGKLVLHRPTASFLGAAHAVLFPELNFSDANVNLVLRRDASGAAIRLANHDLYWIEQAGDWNKPELLSTNIAARYYRKQFNLPTYNTLQVENMPTHSNGGPGPGGWWLYSNGYVAQNLDFGAGGTYLFNVKASGTPALGGWPQMSLMIDGVAQDSVTVPISQVAYYALSAEVPPGTHQLAISFDNDAYSPPEDRNLFLDEIRWGHGLDNDPVTLLTRPGAVAQVRRGNGLILLDEIEWDTETNNTTKAGRFASSLLTGLGASLRLPQAVRIEAESMTNIDVAAYNVSGGIAQLNSNGHIETSLRFTASGSYSFEIDAGGTPAQGVLPQVALLVDGVSRTNFFLNSAGMTLYAVTIPVPAGTHRIGLAFLNDFYAPPEDRNAAFEYFTITPATAPRITAVNGDAAHQLATLQWEAAPGKQYQVQMSAGLSASAAWLALTNLVSTGNILSWQDNGSASGSPPFGANAAQRYYRIRQLAP